ncbi:hypothetical protein HL663_14740 [Arthrobacter sp. NEB 688]|nr:hypothetical protein HL663_14740 [Arthrobacter sp. NEB 688]
MALPLAASVVAASVLTLSTTDALSAFTAQITDSVSTVGAGTLQMTETQSVGGATTTCTSTDGGSVATNSATCTTINSYGGATTLVPGESSTSSVTLSNTGTHAASGFTLEPGACSQSGDVSGSANDLCDTLLLSIDQTVNGTTTNVLRPTSLDDFRAANRSGGSSGPLALGAVAAGASRTFTFTVTLPAGTGNAYQGLTATQGLTWLFTAGS